MNDGDYNTQYYRTANKLIIGAILLFLVFRMINAVVMGEPKNALIVASITVLLLLIPIFLLSQFRVGEKSSFAVPILLFLIYIVTSFIMESFTYFFGISIAINSLGALYLNKKGMSWYLIITNILGIVLVSLRLPLSSNLRTPPYSEILVNYALLLTNSFCIYILTRYAADKNKSALLAQESFRSLFLTTKNFTVLLDENSKVTFISAPLLDFLNLKSVDEAVGRPLMELFKGYSEMQGFLSKVLLSDGFYETTFTTEINGSTKYLRVVHDAMHGSIPNAILIDVADVTSIMEAKLTAEKASRAKSEFLAVMSHEIRTPMNAIIGISELMRTDNLDKNQLDFFEDMKSMSKSLLKILNDILDFSKMEAGKLILQDASFNVRKLFDTEASIHKFMAQGKDLEFLSEFDSSLPAYLYGDDVRIRQIISNLLSNAIKYTDEGSIYFQMGKDEWQDGSKWLKILVRDTGRGIKDDDLDKIFVKFQQLDRMNSHGVIGTGLGLSIAKEIVNLMNGRIYVDSVYGSGAEFTVFIPLRIGEEANDAASAPHVCLRDDAVKVLVVDDNMLNLKIALAFLSKHNIYADSASSGEEALAKVKENKYHLILMDHMMPGMDGVETTKAIRALPGDWYVKSPIVALSANAVDGARELFLDSGMNDSILKPIDSAALNAILGKWLPPEAIDCSNKGIQQSG
ncbi:MAG: response regulator [Clostridiales bacterium]|jgi:signal transduction histidine kinase|nr:response regulator [Clostridiales bacterium]